MSAAEMLAKEVGVNGKQPSRTSTTRPRSDSDLFGAANRVDTRSVLDTLGIAHDEKFATCPGCSEEGALICENGGIKCQHNRCNGAGPKTYPGFRTNVDIVAHAKQLAPADAAKLICDWNGIAVPERRREEQRTEEPPPGRFDDEGEDVPPSGLEGREDRQPVAETTPKAATSKARTLADIVGLWAEEGPVTRVSTGIAPLDRLCNGGLPVPRRVIIVGAPSAGKTAISVIIADKLTRAAEAAGMCVGILGVDEEPEDLAVRLLQIAGYSVAETDERDPAVLAQMRAAVADLRIRLYDDEFTIEAAAADLARWANEEKRRAALFLDSLHAVRSLVGAGAQNPREAVDANVRAMRAVSTKYKMLVVASAEANRASYRTDDAADTTNDLAAGAESRAVEFGAQTQLMLRTPKDHPNVIHVRVAKNRRLDRGEFWLRLDRARHSVEECADPSADPATAAEMTERRRAGVRAEVLRDAEDLAKLLVRHPDGLGEEDLRAALKVDGHKWGVTRLNAARGALANGHKGVRLVSKKDGKKMVSSIVSDSSERGGS